MLNTDNIREIADIDWSIAVAEAEYNKSGRLYDAELALLSLRRKYFSSPVPEENQPDEQS